MRAISSIRETQSESKAPREWKLIFIIALLSFVSALLIYGLALEERVSILSIKVKVLESKVKSFEKSLHFDSDYEDVVFKNKK